MSWYPREWNDNCDVPSRRNTTKYGVTCLRVILSRLRDSWFILLVYLVFLFFSLDPAMLACPQEENIFYVTCDDLGQSTRPHLCYFA